MQEADVRIVPDASTDAIASCDIPPGNAVANGASASPFSNFFRITFGRRSETTAMRLSRLIYFSQNQIDMAGGSLTQQLGQIQSVSKSNNQPLGLTGALVFDNYWFMQALEGDREIVWRTYRKIESDERHSDLVVVEAAEVSARLFGNWWMGMATRNTTTEPVFAPFLRNGLLRPHDMRTSDFLALMTALASNAFSRKLATAA